MGLSKEKLVNQQNRRARNERGFVNRADERNVPKMKAWLDSLTTRLSMSDSEKARLISTSFVNPKRCLRRAANRTLMRLAT